MTEQDLIHAIDAVEDCHCLLVEEQEFVIVLALLIWHARQNHLDPAFVVETAYEIDGAQCRLGESDDVHGPINRELESAMAKARQYPGDLSSIVIRYANLIIEKPEVYEALVHRCTLDGNTETGIEPSRSIAGGWSSIHSAAETLISQVESWR